MADDSDDTTFAILMSVVGTLRRKGVLTADDLDLMASAFEMQAAATKLEAKARTASDAAAFLRLVETEPPPLPKPTLRIVTTDPDDQKPR